MPSPLPQPPKKTPPLIKTPLFSMGDTTVMFGMMLKMVIENFSTQFDLDEVQRAFGHLGHSASRSRLDQALETVRLNIQWRRLNQKDLELWLRRWHARAVGVD